MAIIVTIISILAITGIAWVLKKVLALKICPVCVSVALTWLWLFTGILLGQLPITNYQLPIAILMGGSVVGITYQIEKHFHQGQSPLLWKTFFLVAGFVAAYSLISLWWVAFAGTVVLMIIITLLSRKPSNQNPQKKAKIVQELLKKMERCC